MKVNKPEFITAVRIPKNMNLHFEDNTVKMTVKTMSRRIAEDVNSTILKGIYETAKDHGITDLFLINEKTVIDAFNKQIPQTVKYLNRHGEGHDIRNKDYYHCPACGRRLRNKQHDPYCPKCGQALDWSDENEQKRTN